MANWAKINSESIVEDILVCDYDFIEVIKKDNPDFSYVEYSDDNYAAPGYPYNVELEKFLTPKPFPSWVLDEEIWEYVAPVACPNEPGKYYVWEEMNTEWVEITPVV